MLNIALFREYSSESFRTLLIILLHLIHKKKKENLTKMTKYISRDNNCMSVKPILHWLNLLVSNESTLSPELKSLAQELLLSLNVNLVQLPTGVWHSKGNF